jgi:hypothetical protein
MFSAKCVISNANYLESVIRSSSVKLTRVVAVSQLIVKISNF